MKVELKLFSSVYKGKHSEIRIANVGTQGWLQHGLFAFLLTLYIFYLRYKSKRKYK